MLGAAGFIPLLDRFADVAWVQHAHANRFDQNGITLRLAQRVVAIRLETLVLKLGHDRDTGNGVSQKALDARADVRRLLGVGVDLTGERQVVADEDAGTDRQAARQRLVVTSADPDRQGEVLLAGCRDVLAGQHLRLDLERAEELGREPVRISLGAEGFFGDNETVLAEEAINQLDIIDERPDHMAGTARGRQRKDGECVTVNGFCTSMQHEAHDVSPVGYRVRAPGKNLDHLRLLAEALFCFRVLILPC